MTRFDTLGPDSQKESQNLILEQSYDTSKVRNAAILENDAVESQAILHQSQH